MTSIWKDLIDNLMAFACGPVEPHAPTIVHVGCIDAREKAGGHFAYADDAVRVTEISAVVPVYDVAAPNMRAKFSFASLMDIPRIKIVGHSYCGGAKMAINNPDLADIENEDVLNVVQGIVNSGIDLPFLSQQFLTACQGNKDHAADLLSRHLVLVSMVNVANYPSLSDRVKNGQTILVPLYHVMKEGTGESGHLEIFDVSNDTWHPVSEEVVHAFSKENMSFTRALDYVEFSSYDFHGKKHRVALPRHIANHVGANREIYQPTIAALQVGG